MQAQSICPCGHSYLLPTDRFLGRETVPCIDSTLIFIIGPRTMILMDTLCKNLRLRHFKQHSQRGGSPSPSPHTTRTTNYDISALFDTVQTNFLFSIRDGPPNNDGIFFPGNSAVYLSTLPLLGWAGSSESPQPNWRSERFVGLLLLRHKVA
ncbi:hypothetical protein BO85DRAFT_2532 [Aspergillus piperis CBS 112811]|uniref:Uncharacterized protein n=1 Tax=Aspergillus piperis CBS 112811 TaxID=1448313 RepID=A0A8G1RFX2_9EURO|nr:hypothetical protein BO85DRAFT_2532 [Aspergillus piperis CBS 112811]RAH62560.1 hypothetical protein BO85DRAFT_2532 [Aspergillus piperis CBS 112811]